MNRFLLPLIVFIALVVLLAIGLRLNPKEVPSPFIGKPAPSLTSPGLYNPQKTLSLDNLKGQVWVLNIWASWCVGCRIEHPQIKALSQQSDVLLIGLNYKDDPEDATNWLKRWGNPYDYSVTDQDGRAGIDWGVYGVPETFIIDHEGIVRYKHIGPVDVMDLKDTLLPIIERLQATAKG